MFFQFRTIETRHAGQSLVELAIGLPFFMMLFLALVEMGILFASYEALVNAAREGAFFAATCPDLLDSSQDASTSCTNSTDTNIEMYRRRVADDVAHAVGYDLFNGGMQIQDTGCNGTQTPNNGVGQYLECLKVDRPIAQIDSLTGITSLAVTVHYRVTTFSSTASMPYVGRLGLPNYYQIDYSMSVARLDTNQ